MAEKPPPPPPKGKPKAAPPPPPKKSPPPPPTKKAAPPPPPKKSPPPASKEKKRAPPSKRPSPPKGKKRAPPRGAPKGKPKGKPSGKKKKRRLRIGRKKLGLSESEISSEDQQYTDQVGWTVGEMVLEELEDEKDKGPEIITHQCSMCGSMMQIPKPKRERYKVVCAYSECGHADMIGL